MSTPPEAIAHSPKFDRDRRLRRRAATDNYVVDALTVLLDDAGA
jgi:hypothetical protein